MLRENEILSQLDQCSAFYNFPMLDNGYIYLAGTKLSAYRDNERWIIIIEVIGFNYRSGGHYGISNCLHIFGNCLSYPPGIPNNGFIYLTEDAKNESTFDEQEDFYLNPQSSSFLLRGEIEEIIHDREIYKSSGITLEDESRINAFEFLRLLNILYNEKLVATENEIRECIPVDIPRIIELENWFHPDIVKGELPSENETFKQIAKILETGDIDYYKPTNEPNTHWENWPEGGTL